MHYWNRDNFKGLVDLAAALDEHDGLSRLAEFCRLRERGLRSEAFRELEGFLHEATAWDRSRSRRACQDILELWHSAPSVHQFLVHPLRQRFVEPVLTDWCEAEGTTPIPIRWLGLLRHDFGLLRTALQMDPQDLPVRSKIIEACLSDVDHATHHLNEGLFLGDLADAESALSEATALIEAVPEESAFREYREEAEYYERMLDDWRTYKSSDSSKSFPAFCADLGRDYRWSKAYYY